MAEEDRPNLTLKQRRFVEAYVGESRGNATEAARIAGYSDPEQSGWQNKKKVEILAAIEEILKARTLSAQEVLDRLTEHANANLSYFMKTGRDGEPVPDLSTPQAKEHFHLLKKIKTKRRTGGDDERPWEEVEVELELHDPQAALVHIGRHHKLFTDRQEVSGNNGGPLVITSIEAVRPAVTRSDGDNE